MNLEDTPSPALSATLAINRLLADKGVMPDVSRDAELLAAVMSQLALTSACGKVSVSAEDEASARAELMSRLEVLWDLGAQIVFGSGAAQRLGGRV